MASPQHTQVKEREIGRRSVETEAKAGIPGWMGWSALGILILAVGILVALVIDGDQSDGSFEMAEQIRQQQLAEPAPAVNEFDLAEAQRFSQYAPARDDSSQVAETRRFSQYAPAQDHSAQVAETQRFSQYAPDTSNDLAEEARMKALAPTGSDGSFEANEHNRMSALGS